MKKRAMVDQDVVIRNMAEDDLDRVAELEKVIFPDPWPRSAFDDTTEHDGWGGFVAEADGDIIGYACYFIICQESHLTNIAVVESWRRKLVANQLLNAILEIVTESECEFLLLEVRPSNLPAVAFYERHGFTTLYRRPNYYRRPPEDALVLVKYLTEKETRATNGLV